MVRINDSFFPLDSPGERQAYKYPGEWLYEDQNGQPLAGAATEDPATPRQDLDDLVQGFSKLSTTAGDDYEADDDLDEASTQLVFNAVNDCWENKARYRQANDDGPAM
ncbi:hypothetical protein HYQ45_018999 [Verticillium longisporum]|uniref:Uncharacterized protein n=1 Tax=Verticillium longisporum TaxID=100787 RepID=A0A8I2Z6X2_VERLO|nr:hypothetical protein HYQ45_018999 [Verticillium longisporum]